MKIPSLFSKVPKYRKFNYTPRWYDPQEEERREREERIKKEIRSKEDEESAVVTYDHRTRIAGSFKSARRASRHLNPSAGMLRLLAITFLVISFIAYLEYGNVALYSFLLFVPFYFFLKLRGSSKQQ